MRRSVVFVLFDGVKLIDVSGPAEVFSEAARFGAEYDLTYASSGEDSVRTSAGTRLAVDTLLDDVDYADTVIVTGGDGLVSKPIPPRLVDAIRRARARSRRMVSICTGSFLLAATGILSGRRATTHWRYANQLARLYPDITVLPDALFVEDDSVYTSAGGTAGIDLALALVEQDHSADLARSIARHLVMFMQRPAGQSQYSAPLSISPPRSSVVRKAIDAVSANPGQRHSIASLASAVGVSARHLTRLFSSELGMTPAQFVQRVRIDHAKSLLDSGHDVTRTAHESGFGSYESMRRAFVNVVGVSPSVYRSRFLTTKRGGDVQSLPTAV